MKFIKKLIIGIVFSILLFFTIYYLTRSNIEKMILDCHKYYKSSMSLDYTTLNNENKNIEIHFKLNISWKQEVVAKTYKAIIDTFYNNENSEYKDYTIDIYFVCLDEEIVISNINRSLRNIEFHCNTSVLIKDISELFPYVTELHLCPAYYDNISEINKFTSLNYIYFSQGFTSEEEEYILSLYPACVIDK